MRTKLRLVLSGGFIFNDAYIMLERAHRKVCYADKQGDTMPFAEPSWGSW